jgi:hypothetical protein
MDGHELFGAVAVRPDGQHLYVASRGNAVAVFVRNARTGELTQLRGVAGCISDDRSDDGMAMVCADGNGLLGAIVVTVSPAGLNVYGGLLYQQCTDRIQQVVVGV